MITMHNAKFVYDTQNNQRESFIFVDSSSLTLSAIIISSPYLTKVELLIEVADWGRCCGYQFDCCELMKMEMKSSVALQLPIISAPIN